MGDERNLQRIKRQAEREGGELLMLSSNDKVESLSSPTSVLPTRKDTNISTNGLFYIIPILSHLTWKI